MSNVVNLNKFRKAKAKADKETTAKANRRKHGRTKAERAQDKADAERETSAHEGHRLDAGEGDPGEEPT